MTKSIVSFEGRWFQMGQMLHDATFDPSCTLRVVACLLVLAIFPERGFGGVSAADREEARQDVTIMDWSYSVSPFHVMTATLLITNGSRWDIKDMAVRCTHTASSGTRLNASRQTIYELIPSLSAREFKVNMGFVDAQTRDSVATVYDLDFVSGVEVESKEERKARLLAKSKEESDQISAQDKWAEEQRLRASADRVEKARRLLAWQFSEASNGTPSAQCSIGLRYLRGDGLETNLPLARYWLQKAASNQNAQARQTLITLPVE